jgi:hypothetical protein
LLKCFPRWRILKLAGNGSKEKQKCESRAIDFTVHNGP